MDSATSSNSSEATVKRVDSSSVFVYKIGLPDVLVLDSDQTCAAPAPSGWSCKAVHVGLDAWLNFSSPHHMIKFFSQMF